MNQEQEIKAYEDRKVIHKFGDGEEIYVIYDSENKFNRLFRSTCAEPTETPLSCSDEMADFIDGTGLTEDQLYDLVNEFEIWG